MRKCKKGKRGKGEDENSERKERGEEEWWWVRTQRHIKKSEYKRNKKKITKSQNHKKPDRCLCP